MKLDATYRRRLLIYLLLVVVVGIWGRVIYSVYEQVEGVESMPEDTPGVLGSVLAEAASLPPERPVYTDDFPDPFNPPRTLFYRPKPKAANKPVAQPEKTEEPVIPQLTLHGITGITATVGCNNLVHFVKPGDSVEGVKILDVEHDQVLARFANTTFTLKLNK